MTVTKTGLQKRANKQTILSCCLLKPEVVYTTESPGYLQLVSTFQSYDMT